MPQKAFNTENMNIQKLSTDRAEEEEGGMRKEEENAAVMCTQVNLILKLGHKGNYTFLCNV